MHDLTDTKNLKIILHIGLPKTGTTWLQDVFYPHQKGIHYIDVAPQNYPAEQHPMIVEFIHVANTPHEELSQEKLQLIRHNIQRYFHKGINLLSNENYFTGMPSTVSITDITNISCSLKNLYPQLKIILILRNQLSLLSSLYLQRLYMANEYRSFKQFLHSFRNSLIPYLKYIELVNAWHDALGRENVYISTYEHFLKDRTQFLKNLCTFIGIENPELNVSQRTYVNRSLSFYSAIIMFFANQLHSIKRVQHSEQLTCYANYFTHNIAKFCKDWLDPKVIHKYGLYKKISNPNEYFLSEYYGKSNVELSKITQLDLKDLGYPYKSA
ncbi:MAG: sulfotransferase domain-containing protein [Deltaproteobacteria bacterium]|nr:sulfotransferase domain-containing protein [Deltaproteobacteria bacterium]